MAITPIPPQYGTAVTGQHRFPRPEVEAEFDSVMRHTNGARLFGLRRTGKSTEALACRDRLKADPAITLVELDAQGCTNEAKLLLDILQALPGKGWRERITQAITADGSIAQAARDALHKATGAQTEVLAYFAQIMHAVERVIEANDHIVVLIDEFPWLCRSILQSDPANGRSRVDVLLAALRRWRGKGVRMMLLGSIGMAALGRQYRLDLSHLNDLKLVEVPPLPREEAEALVQCLVLGSAVQGWTPTHTALLLDECVTFYPAIIQQAFLQLIPGQKAALPERMVDIFADKIRPEQDAVFFAQFDRRLQLYRDLPAPLPDLLSALLAQVMNSPQQMQTYPELRQACAAAPQQAAADSAALDDADLGDALAVLHEDGFLSLRAPRNAPQQWRAASGLVTAWWMQRRGGAH